MSVLIKGMEMPMKPDGIGSSGMDLRIWDDGTIELLNGYHKWRTDYKAIELPPHGDLIDRDELKMAWDGVEENMHTPVAVIRALIDDTPTIIEAEGE